MMKNIMGVAVAQEVEVEQSSSNWKIDGAVVSGTVHGTVHLQYHDISHWNERTGPETKKKGLICYPTFTLQNTSSAYYICSFKKVEQGGNAYQHN